MLSACFVFSHAASGSAGWARCQTALSRQAPGRVSGMVSHRQASAHATGIFQISSWNQVFMPWFLHQNDKSFLACLRTALEFCCLFLSLHSAGFGTGTGLSIPPSALWVCKFWPHQSAVISVLKALYLTGQQRAISYLLSSTLPFPPYPSHTHQAGLIQN